ncbi:MAG: transglutaminase-like domain-containing protein, partial [Planctomycetota bacterium]
MRRIRIALLALLLAAVARAGETVKETWGVVHMMGKPVGHAHTVVRTTDDSVETTIVTKMTIKRMGAEMTVESTQKTVERPDGRLVRMSTLQKMSAVETKSEITFKDGKAHIVTTTMGQPREATLDCPADAVGPARIEEIGKGLIHQPGAKAEAGTFAQELGGAVLMTISVIGEEEIGLLDGEKRTLTRIEAVPDKAPIKTVSWMTKDGETLKTQVAIGGLLIEMYTTTRERALGAGSEELTPDLFKRMLIVAEHPVPYARRVDTALLVVRTEESLPEFTGSNQVVEATDAGVARVRIRTARPPRGGTRPLEPAEAYAGCLEANSMIQSDAPEIVAIAKEVVGDMKDAWRAAQTLERWVHDNLTEKNLGVGFASALEVCRNREGDCTEHSVFLAALCRAAGIPARVAMGFEYIAGTWAGHAWNEVWIDGRWYALDATNGHGSADAL